MSSSFSGMRGSGSLGGLRRDPERGHHQGHGGAGQLRSGLRPRVTGRAWSTSSDSGSDSPRANAHSTSWCEPKWRSTRRPASTSAAISSSPRQGAFAPLRRHLHAHRASPGGVRDVLDVLRVHRPAHDLAGDLADQVVVGRRLPADDRDAEAPARVDGDHARVAADRVAREQHARDLGVDHPLDGHAHRLVHGAELARGRRSHAACTGWPSSRGRRRRAARCRAPRDSSPAARRTSRRRCPRRARSSGRATGRLGQLLVARAISSRSAVRERREPHRLANRLRGVVRVPGRAQRAIVPSSPVTRTKSR